MSRPATGLKRFINRIPFHAFIGVCALPSHVRQSERAVDFNSERDILAFS